MTSQKEPTPPQAPTDEAPGGVVCRDGKVHASPGPWWWLDNATLVCRQGARVVLCAAARSYGGQPGLFERGEDGRLHPLKIGGPNAMLIAAAPLLLECSRAALLLAAGDSQEALRNILNYGIRRADGRP